MIDLMWSNALFNKCDEWEKRFDAWFMALPLTERPMTSIEYILANGPSSGNAEKMAAYNNFMRAAQLKCTELRQHYADTIEPYPVKRFK